jgi:NAD(P)H-hydrate epimerase
VSELPKVALADVPAVSAADMAEIDRLAIDEFGVGLVQMMELAGANLSRSAVHLLGNSEGPRVTVLVGPGNNGAGGLVAARHLVNRGARVHVVLAVPVRRLRAIARERLATLIEMRVACCVAAWDLADGDLDELLTDSDLLIDALLGYSVVGPPRGDVAGLISRAATSGSPVLSLDLPSGIHPDTGAADGTVLPATATMTLALPKRGLVTDGGVKHAGRLLLADIGLPSALYERAGLDFRDPFLAGPVVRLD